MKLVDTLILAACAAFLVIGIYEMITQGPSFGYWSVMLSVILFFWFTYRKRG